MAFSTCLSEFFKQFTSKANVSNAKTKRTDGNECQQISGVMQYRREVALRSHALHVTNFSTCRFAEFGTKSTCCDNDVNDTQRGERNKETNRQKARSSREAYSKRRTCQSAQTITLVGTIRYCRVFRVDFYSITSVSI